MSVDWLKIRNDYINGLGGAAELSRRYGVKSSTIRNRARREGWKVAAKKQCDTIATLCDEKAARAVADGEAERILSISSVTTKAAKYLDRRMDTLLCSPNKAYEVKVILEAAKIIRDMDRAEAKNESDGMLEQYLAQMQKEIDE